MCYMRTISQRELRNDNAEVMRSVEQGEVYTVTRRGVPVARLSPITPDSELRCVRAATAHVGSASRKRARLETRTAEVLDDLRGDR